MTLPAPIRHALGLEGESELTVEIDTDQDAIILRPTVVLRREDAWVYTPEHRALLERAHGDSRAGRVHNLSEGDLRSLGT